MAINYKRRVKNALTKAYELRCDIRNEQAEDVAASENQIEAYEDKVFQFAEGVTITEFYKICNEVDGSGSLAEEWAAASIIDYCAGAGNEL